MANTRMQAQSLRTSAKFASRRISDVERMLLRLLAGASSLKFIGLTEWVTALTLDRRMELTLEQLQARLSRNHLANWIRLVIVSAAAGEIKMAAPWRDEFISNPDHRFVHGGILATLLDTAGSYAVATLLGRPATTVDMRVDFLRPGLETQMIVEANVIHYGRTLATADASVLNAANQPLATSRMVFLTSSRQPRSGAIEGSQQGGIT